MAHAVQRAPRKRRDSQGRWRDARGHFTTAPKRQKTVRKKVKTVRKSFGQRDAALASVMAQIVPIGAEARRSIARDAIKVAPHKESELRTFSTQQHLLLLLQGSWDAYHAKAAQKTPKGVINPYWYHLVKETRA